MSTPPAKFFVNQGVVSSRTDILHLLRPLLKQTVTYRYVRGRDTVSVFEATDPGHPHLAAEHAVGAAWPRHHAHLDDRTVVVAAQEGDALVELDLVTGSTRRVLGLTAPTCVLPLD